MKPCRVIISPSHPHGTVTAPPSKSISHRALICAAMASGESVIANPGDSADIGATLSALASMGAGISRESDGSIRVIGFSGKPRPLGGLDCNESGSTLRFLIPICLLSEDAFELSGSERLLSRPLGIYRELFGERLGEVIGNTLPIRAGNPLVGRAFTVAGNISSQFISGLLFALPLCERDSTLTVLEPFESSSYIDLTVSALALFGIDISREGNTFLIRGGQRYRPARAEVEGDASNAAFLEALNLLGGDVRVQGISPDSLQGDRVYTDHLGAIARGEAIDSPIDLGDCPDLAPILFAISAACSGAVFTSTNRLRLKESDRIEAMRLELSAFGAEMKVSDAFGGRVEILPRPLHPPTRTLYSHNDHRIAMSLSVLATRYGGIIDRAEAVTKSYPDFFDTLSSLGVELRVITKEQ